MSHGEVITRIFNSSLKDLEYLVAYNNSFSIQHISSFHNPNYLDDRGRCRWSTDAGEPILFVKHDWNKLNILDVEKKALVLKNSVVTEHEGNYN